LSLLVILSSSKSNCSTSLPFFLLPLVTWDFELLVHSKEVLGDVDTSIGLCEAALKFDEARWCWSLPNPVPPSSELGATEFAWSEAVVAMLLLFCFVDEVYRGWMQDADVEHSSSDSSS
jgi:hypothetical protein